MDLVPFCKSYEINKKSEKEKIEQKYNIKEGRGILFGLAAEPAHSPPGIFQKRYAGLPLSLSL
jgi:hypothetical protein